MKNIRQGGRAGAAHVLVSVSMLAVGVLGVALLAASSAARHQRLYFDIGNRAQYAAESGRSYVYARRTGNKYYVPAGTFTLGVGDQFSLHTVRDGSNLVVTTTGVAHPGTPRESHRSLRFMLDYNPVVAIDDVFLWAQELSTRGSGVVAGPGGVVVLTGDISAEDVRGGMDIQVTTIFIEGNTLMNAAGNANLGSSTDPGNIYIAGNLEMLGATPTIYGDVHVGGNLIIATGMIHGNMYVHGNVEVRGTGFDLVGDSHIYYAGTLTPAGILPDDIIHILPDALPPLLMPDAFTPVLRAPEWYATNRYDTDSADLVDNLKVYTADDFSGISNDSLTNVVIVSEGNIALSVKGGGVFVGVLIAPNGSVTFTGTSFEGMVIAGQGLYIASGSPEVTFKSITEFFDSPDDYPVILDEEF